MSKQTAHETQRPRPAARRARAAAVPEPAAAGAAAADTAPAADAAAQQAPGREERIRLLAYARYERNGRVDGHALDDWLAAEASVGAVALSGETSPDARCAG